VSVTKSQTAAGQQLLRSRRQHLCEVKVGELSHPSPFETNQDKFSRLPIKIIRSIRATICAVALYGSRDTADASRAPSVSARRTINVPLLEWPTGQMLVRKAAMCTVPNHRVVAVMTKCQYIVSAPKTGVGLWSCASICRAMDDNALVNVVLRTEPTSEAARGGVGSMLRYNISGYSFPAVLENLEPINRRPATGHQRLTNVRHSVQTPSVGLT
jgi:hypothetical protein